MNSISDIDAAYLAGIIDGEGCITLRNYKQRQARGGIVVYISNSNRDVLEWTKVLLGCGCINKVKANTKKSPNAKQTWVYVVCNRKAASLLKAIRPYLKIKALQADVCIKYNETIGAGGRIVPLEVRDQRQSMVGEIRKLNKRGIIEEEKPWQIH